MSQPTAPDPSALSPEDAAHLPRLLTEILAAGKPGDALLDAITALEPRQKPALAAALYEALCYRVPVEHYWLQFRIWKVYRALGPARDDAAFRHATMAVRLAPAASGSGQAFRDIFLFLQRRGRDRPALDVLAYQALHLPEQPAASPDEVARILARLGGPPPPAFAPLPAPRTDALRLRSVIPPETRPPWRCPVFGGDMPYALLPLTHGMARPAISVAEFDDAEVLLHRDAIVVCDRFGDLHEAFSVRGFPRQVRDAFDSGEARGEETPTIETEHAVVIADEVPLANICHVLLDHMTRLELYRRAGADLGRALVIGAEARMPAQHALLRRAGVATHLGTDRIARVRARLLFVSSNCRDVSHAAHFGAGWAVAYTRALLGGQGTKGWRRLYLSRDDVAFRRVVNEAAVIALLEPHGFEVIRPGELPYDAQIAAFKQASHVIAPHGAALAHVVALPPDAHVLEMFHPLYGTAAYAMQAAASGFHYAAMLARDWESDAPQWNDPALADIAHSKFLERHMSVDLGALSDYLATVL